MSNFFVRDLVKTIGTGNERAIKAVLAESYPEYRILSTDSMPVAKQEEKGAVLIKMDTGEVYFNHGGTWGKFE